MTNSFSDNSAEKPEDKSEEKLRLFGVSPLAAAFVILAVLAVFAVISYQTYNWIALTGPERCRIIEYDARITERALYHYLKDSEQLYVPTFEELAVVYNIEVHRNSNVVIAGTRGKPTITVFDIHDMCPRGPSYIVYMGQRLSHWQRY